MLAEQFGKLVRDQRVRKRLRQVDVARSAAVSRTVLSRLEQGRAQPVQTDVLDRLLQVLEISPQVVARSGPDAARRQARLELQSRLEQQRIRHLRLAIELVDDEVAAPIMIAKAWATVQLWRRNATCNSYYIERWSEVLRLSPRKMAKAMASLGDWEDALFQNSPWSWAWN
ncbi:MAG: helix-turn-helix domain-containing protein [Betaproteobacteria bacterium]|nr:helix-turn-helix domain-containing protein [Betaproteobacteria bacterium]